MRTNGLLKTEYITRVNKDSGVADVMKALLRRFYLTAYVVTDGRLYLLPYHWRYLNPIKQAPRVLVSKRCTLKTGFYYITEL
jgi:hypothetical protein